MHQTDKPYLSNKNIRVYLNRLSELLAISSSDTHSVLIVGGAAIALGYNFKRSTVDIDICVSRDTQLYNCSQSVATEFNGEVSIPAGIGDGVVSDGKPAENLNIDLSNTDGLTTTTGGDTLN